MALLGVLLVLVIASQVLPAGTGSDDRAEALAQRLSGVVAVPDEPDPGADRRERVLFVLQGVAGVAVFGWAVHRLGKG